MNFRTSKLSLKILPQLNKNSMSNHVNTYYYRIIITLIIIIIITIIIIIIIMIIIIITILHSTNYLFSDWLKA